VRLIFARSARARCAAKLHSHPRAVRALDVSGGAVAGCGFPPGPACHAISRGCVRAANAFIARDGAHAAHRRVDGFAALGPHSGRRLSNSRLRLALRFIPDDQVLTPENARWLHGTLLPVRLWHSRRAPCDLRMAADSSTQDGEFTRSSSRFSPASTRFVTKHKRATIRPQDLRPPNRRSDRRPLKQSQGTVVRVFSAGERPSDAVRAGPSVFGIAHECFAWSFSVRVLRPSCGGLRYSDRMALAAAVSHKHTMRLFSAIDAARRPVERHEEGGARETFMQIARVRSPTFERLPHALCSVPVATNRVPQCGNHDGCDLCVHPDGLAPRDLPRCHTTREFGRAHRPLRSHSRSITSSEQPRAALFHPGWIEAFSQRRAMALSLAGCVRWVISIFPRVAREKGCGYTC